MDLVVGGTIENAWLDLYQQAFSRLFINPSRLAGKRPPARPRPARPMSFYTGAYANAYYGSISVVAPGSELHVLIGPRPNAYALRHWDGNVFAFLPVGESALGVSAATFRPGARRATSLTLEYYDTRGLGTFTRS
jgi:hypothetical protein